MKNLFLLLLTAVILTACKNTNEEPIFSEVVEMQYAMCIQSPTGETLINNQQSTNGVTPNLVRLRYVDEARRLANYAHAHTYDRPYGIGYHKDTDLLAIEIIPSTNSITKIPFGYSTTINYIDWPNKTSDKIEAIIHRFGSVTRVEKLFINDKLIWEITEENKSNPILIKKVIDGDKSDFETVEANWVNYK